MAVSEWSIFGTKQLAQFGIVTSDQITSATVLRAETLARQYARDPLAADLMQRAQSIVHTCAMINAGACVSQPLRLYRRVGSSVGSSPFAQRSVPPARRKALSRGTMGMKVQSFADSGADMKEIMDHPALQFVRNPNAAYPGGILERMGFYFRGITGNWYTIVTKDKGLRAWPGYPQYVTPTWSKDEPGQVEGYNYGRDSTDMVSIAPEHVLHYRNNLSRTNPLMGEGELAGVVPEVDLILRTNMHDLAFVQNGNRPDSMIKLTSDAKPTPEQMKTLADSLDDWGAGGAREGKPFVGWQMDWVPLAFNPKDLRTLEQLANYEKRIRFAFGIPESMADSNASTYASAGVADAQHGRVIRAKLIDDAAQKTEMILARLFGLDPNEWCFVYDDPVPKDELADQTRLISLTGAGGLTINEMRAELGYDQADDPMADSLLFNGQPLGAAAPQMNDPFAGLFGGAPRPQPQPAPEPDPDPEPPAALPVPVPVPDEDGTKAATPTPVSLTKSMLSHESYWWAQDEDGCKCCKAAPNLPVGLVRDMFERYGPGLAALMEDVLTDAQDEAVQAYGRGELPDLAPLREQSEKLLLDQVREMAEYAIRSELTAAGALEDAFSVVDERAIEFARSYTIQLADDIFATTSDMAKEAVTRGLEQGLSIDKIADEIEGVPKYRAEMIARTETNRAANSGQYETFKILGAKNLEWVLSPGACPLCTAIAARGTRPVGEPFAVAGETLGGVVVRDTLLHSPAHPNDRCTMIAQYPTGDDE
jgi:hypothetical protein